MKTFSKHFLLALTVIGFAFLFQSNKEKIKSEEFNGNSLNLHCPSPPSFIQFANSEMKNDIDNKNEEIDHNWYQNAINNIEKEEYEIKYSEELGAYQSPNRANNIRFIYHKDGFTAKTRTNKIPKFDVNDKTLKEEEKEYETVEDWSVEFKVESGEWRMENEKLQASGNKAWIENGEIRIDYTNDKGGMRQDFIIKRKPEGEGKLRLNLSAETKLKMIVGADALMFKDDKGQDKMKYSSLKCWDANGRELRAYFERNSELGIRNYELKSIIKDQKSKIKTIPNSKFLIRNSFSIVVNEEDAVYPITIDPLSENPVWTFENNQSNSAFGYSVSTAGDVNGDGYSDVIAGSPFFDNGQTDEGRAYVFHGSATGLSTFANWISESDTATSNFGWSVATAGDVNGDGYSDVIIGAPNFENGQNNEGKVYVFHGSASGLSLTPNWTIQKDQADAHLGSSVSTAGDVNNDGYSDIIFSAPDLDDGETDEGKVFLHYGSSSGLSISSDKNLQTNVASDNFGTSVSLAGDVNGDGFSDVIIGAMNSENGQTNEGRAFIYTGSAGGTNSTSFWTGESNQSNANFGISVSTAGDVNGDGYSDVIVGAHNYENDSTSEGRAFVYYGNPSSMSTTAAWTEDINQRFAFFGYSVSTAGDVNGDGYGDIIVGAYGFTNGETDEGKAYVYFGSSTGLPSSADWTDVSNQVSAFFGRSVATAGDVNGDGFSEIIVGAMQYDNGQSNEGGAFLYQGYADGLRETVNWTYEINQVGAYFGLSVSSAGDVNGDGFSDVIVGAPIFDDGETNEGSAFVFHGSAAGLSTFPNWTAEGNQLGVHFGIEVSTAGDVNGDGYSDVIIGAYLYTNGESEEGRAFVFLGSASGLSDSADWTAESNQSDSEFGRDVSTAGDVNGDGYSEVIVGANKFMNGQIQEGRAFVYYGSEAGLSDSANWISESNQLFARYGTSVSSAGDVNGDGYSDVIVGASWYDNGLNDEGGAFVYHGSSSGLGLTAIWIAEGNFPYANFGMSVSGAGDVNGDGYSDVIVGAGYEDGGQAQEGKAYLYKGSATGLLPNPLWVTAGNGEDQYYGTSVSSAGDVNGDGYSDLIIGAPGYLNNTGRAYLFYGSESRPDYLANWYSESNQDNADYGSSVSSAGDINGDGYSDVIIGAYGYGNNETDEGRVFVYYGNRKTGLRSTVQQYEPGTSDVISSGGITGSNGNVKLNLFGRSPYGRSEGKIVYEYKENSQPFSGSIITNSTSSSGSGILTDLGLTGIDLSKEISGLNSGKEYKWRARVQYDISKNPFQKYGPWKYYSNYVPEPYSGFKPKSELFQLTLNSLVEGFYSSGLNLMVSDTFTVQVRSSSSPYNVVDYSTSILNTSGTGTFIIESITNGVPYYIVIKHRNSIETWSATPQSFVSGFLNYDFTNSSSQAFGNNMVQVDASPIKFAIYGGDVNQDGTVDATDVSTIDNDAANFVSGYVVTDLTGDDFIDGTDFAIADNNAANFVSAITP
jgi:hypothetical protein